MADLGRTTFFEKRTYRRRRLADLARIVPVLGLILLMVPLLWPEGTGGVRTSRAIYWIFGIWVGLVALSAWLSSQRLEHEIDGDSAPRPIAGSAEPPEPR